MDWTEVQQRIAAGEDERTELKRWDRSLDRIAEAVCALANSAGGLLIVGIGDDGSILGVAEDADRVQERLSSFLHTGLSAPVQARLGCHRDAGVHWIEIPRQRGFEPLRLRGRVLVRRGRASVEPSAPELQDLYNTFGFVLTEEQRILGSSVADIDVQAFRTFLRAQGLDTDEEPQPALEDDLQSRGVLASGPDGLAATLYGILCFGRDPQGAAPYTQSFWIDCVAYAGVDRADEVILTGEAKGRADEQVQRAEGWTRALGRREEHGALLRKDTELVPPRALREALVNAVAHRDYAILGSRILLEVFRDRVVVTSPGTLPNHLEPSSVLAGGHPRSRNELIANFLLVRRLMEGRGRGLPVIRRAMREAGGSMELVNDAGGKFVRLTLRLGGEAPWR